MSSYVFFVVFLIMIWSSANFLGNKLYMNVDYRLRIVLAEST